MPASLPLALPSHLVARIGRLASGAGRCRTTAPSLTLGSLPCRSKPRRPVAQKNFAIGPATVPVGRSSSAGSEIRQAPALAAVGRKITRVEPALEGGAQSRPVAVDDREPGGVAVAPAGDHRLAE